MYKKGISDYREKPKLFKAIAYSLKRRKTKQMVKFCGSSSRNKDQKFRNLTFLYPRHLCRRVYSFRLSVCPFVRSYVRSFVRSWNLRQSFALKFLKWCISQQSLIRKHSYLDHSYPGGFAFTPWPRTPGSMPRGGARGQNLGHL